MGMNEIRHMAAAAMFEVDEENWWVTGGSRNGDLRSTEVFNVRDRTFSYGVDLPTGMRYHNLVNVNHTHMVVLGGDIYSDDIFIIDR